MGKDEAVCVVCAILVRNGRVLLARRPAGKHLALKWEFPGGKVEPEEPPVAALIREIREELGCEIEVIEPLPSSRHDYERGTIDLLPFVCRLAGGSSEPHPHEHVAIDWVEPADLLKHDLAPADVPVVTGLFEWWRAQNPPRIC